ncbi:MAG: flippase [Solobacterium sp.]|nr:flippase [Solobacterium sp.]
MDRKILRNYIYNILYQLTKLIFPFLLAPYLVSHVGSETLGIYSFAGKIMNWFILFGILGVNTYGNRQIAKIRDDKEELNRTFFEILSMQICNMILASVAYLLYIRFTVTENLFYFQLTGLTMLASMLDITWFFFGVEDFKKASIRNIIVKFIGVGLIFLLVKTPQDLWKYILINIGSELFGQAIMFLQLREYISFRRISLKDAYRHHFKATFQLFVPTIAISIYTMLDGTMLGYLYSEEHVYFYDTSMNLVKSFLYFITSIGSVMLPRVTNVYYNDESGEEKAQHLIGTTMKIACMFAFPMCLGIVGISQNFISWWMPEKQIIANLIMMGAPVIIFISMSNVTGIQYMVPTGMYNQYSKSVIGGSLINFCVNLMLIPRIGAYGAVIGSVIAECTVTLLQIFMIRQKVHLGLTGRSFRIYFFGSLLMFAAVYGVGRVVPASVIGTALQVLAGVVVYAAVIILTKEELGWKMIEKVWYIKTSKS